MCGDFLQCNSSVIITLVGLLLGCIAGSLTYLLKSRCTSIRCACIRCERDVVPLEKKEHAIKVSDVFSVANAVT